MAQIIMEDFSGDEIETVSAELFEDDHGNLVYILDGKVFQVAAEDWYLIN